MDKWEQLKERVTSTNDAIERRQLVEIAESKKELLAEIESAKNDSVLDELKKLGERIGRLEAKIPDPEPEEED